MFLVLLYESLPGYWSFLVLTILCLLKGTESSIKTTYVDRMYLIRFLYYKNKKKF